MFKKVIHYIFSLFSFKYIMSLVVGWIIFYFFILNSNIAYENNDITVGGNKFHINSHYQVNREGVKIFPDNTFIILKYGPLPRGGGIWRRFLIQQHKSNNNIHVISLMDDKIDINDSLISNIHSIVEKLGVKKYILVFRNIDNEIIRQYTHKYGSEVVEVTPITSL